MRYYGQPLGLLSSRKMLRNTGVNWVIILDNESDMIAIPYKLDYSFYYKQREFSSQYKHV